MSSNFSSLAEAKRLKFQDVFILWTRFEEFKIIPRIINGDKAFVVCVIILYYCLRLHLLCQWPIEVLPWGRLKFLVIPNNKLISVNGAVDLTRAPPCLKSLCWGSQSESRVLSTMSPGPSPSPLWLCSLTSTSPHAQTRTHTLVLWVAPEKMPLWKHLPTVGLWKHWVSVSYLQLYMSVFTCLCVFLCFHHCF